ncbi:MAG: LacI family DNA-binding transcriptional regulator [Clostridiales bacterium]|nr:LacI family DNA-binding transcriptional regulator [Clostridiales bacterium]
MATIKDIANKLGVSISTVSKGLHGASDISEDMRQQVLDTAISLGYIVKKRKSSEKHKVCIMVENMDYANINQFGYELITGFRLMAQEQQYQVDVIPMDVYTQTMQSYDDYMKQNSYSGAFFLGFEMTDTYLTQLTHTSIPTVLFDNYVINKHVAYLGTDNNLGAKALIEHLYENGHRKIALLNGSQNSYISNLRFNVLLKEIKNHGLDVPDELIGNGITFQPKTISSCIPQFVNAGATAVVCASDLIAAAAINEIHRLGLRVPDDISVTGFDDLPIAKYLAPPLTTIRQERFTLGKSAFTLLSQLISGTPVSTVLYHSELIIRESVAKINK